MRGFEQSCSEVENRQFRFGRLPYGQHQIALKSINKRNGSKSFNQIKVNVVEPIYWQNWFLLMTLCGLILLIYAFGKWRIYRLEKKAQFLQLEINKATAKIQRDKTLIEQQAHSLKELNNTKDQLFAIISHDLRKPALSFRGISKKVNYLLQAKQYDALLRVGSSLEIAAINLNKLLDNLLKWALTQKNTLTIELQPFDITVLLQDILQLFAPVIAEKNVIITTQLPSKCFILGDQDMTATILRNLMDNAIKFTPTGKSIQLSVQLLGDQVSCILQDTGIGMTPAQIAEIFQLDQNKSTKGTQGEKGVGLGMILVKELIAAQNGTLQINSTLQQGTMVEVRLPAAL